MAPTHRYGRGKFTHHENYIDYQVMIASHPNYGGMPGAFSEDGKPVWQVSSGKTTSFFQFFEPRQQWWTRKADQLRLAGRGKELDRWTIAARMIHPTGYRHCLVCGEEKNIGYFYLNSRIIARITKLWPGVKLQVGSPISTALNELETRRNAREVQTHLSGLFPERIQLFSAHGYTPEAFEKSNYLRTPWLSPGFMGDPPYRFDGLHDYCTACRKTNDPGRSDENMQSYGHDRRAFEWWAEGNWELADELYSSAGPGMCQLCSPPTSVPKVSPDHVGPLACGFKHLAYFRPTCKPCNSSKNRRMSIQDVKDLIAYERRTGDSPASWQARPIWDKFKNAVRTNSEAEELSAIMRAMQDVYLRSLFRLLSAGRARFLRSLLQLEYALRSYEFVDLDPGELTFSAIKEFAKDTKNRRSLQARVVRIAFEELAVYSSKDVEERRLRQFFTDRQPVILNAIEQKSRSLLLTRADQEWNDVATGTFANEDEREAAIAALLRTEPPGTVGTSADRLLKSYMLEQFEQLAQLATLG